MPVISDFFIKKPSTGIMMGKEHLVSDVDKQNLIGNLDLFFNQQFEELESYKINVNNTKTWKREVVLENTNMENAVNAIQKIQYKGFDYKYLAYDKFIVEGHRIGYIDQISKINPAITVTKKSRKSSFSTASLAYLPIEKCYMSTTDSAYAFLLKYNGKYNLNTSLLSYKVEPEELFYYIYAILYSTKYRHKYSSQLLRNYPRIPITLEREIYINLSKMGFNLGQIHLFHDDYVSTNDLEISDTEDYVVYSDFYYNSNQEMLHFGSNPNAFWVKPITKEVWDYNIGGRKQIYEWLNARKFSEEYKKNTINRPLERSETKYFLNLCISIKNTIETIEEIDKFVKKIL